MDHYICHKVYTSKKRERITDTVEFFPKDVPMPKTLSIDMAIKVAAELTYILKNPASTSPFHKFSDNTLVALDTLEGIFQKCTTQKIEVTTSSKTPPQEKVNNSDPYHNSAQLPRV